jgi:hypothetical protein
MATTKEERLSQGRETPPTDLEAGETLESEGDVDSVADDPSTGRNLTRIATGNSVERVSTHMSLGPDNPVEHYTSFVEVPDEVYDRFPPHRKIMIVVLLSFCSFLAPISSTSVLSATPEVAAEFHSTGTVLDISNAIYMLMMGVSPMIWGPLSEVYGRKRVCPLFSSFFFFAGLSYLRASSIIGSMMRDCSILSRSRGFRE